VALLAARQGQFDLGGLFPFKQKKSHASRLTHQFLDLPPMVRRIEIAGRVI
jgi:hypothetical protein